MQIKPIIDDMFLVPSQLFRGQHGKLPMGCHEHNFDEIISLRGGWGAHGCGVSFLLPTDNESGAGELIDFFGSVGPFDRHLVVAVICLRAMPPSHGVM
jgi:hypothetical protein